MFNLANIHVNQLYASNLENCWNSRRIYNQDKTPQRKLKEKLKKKQHYQFNITDKELIKKTTNLNLMETKKKEK